MPKVKLIVLIGVILIIIGGIGSALTVKSAISTSSNLSEEMFIEPDLIQSIQVASDNASIEILSTTYSEITVEFIATERKFDQYNMQAEVDDDILVIEANEKSRFPFMTFDFGFSAPRLLLYLPEKQYKEILVEVKNGKVRSQGIFVDNLNVETVNGMINLSNMETNETHLTSDNGKLTINHVTGDLTGNVTNGSIDFITNNLDQMIDLHSVNGKITVQTENEPTDATIDVSVSNGKVNVFGNDTRHTVIGEGNNKVNLTTVNGSVTVN